MGNSAFPFGNRLRRHADALRQSLLRHASAQSVHADFFTHIHHLVSPLVLLPGNTFILSRHRMQNNRAFVDLDSTVRGFAPSTPTENPEVSPYHRPPGCPCPLAMSCHSLSFGFLFGSPLTKIFRPFIIKTNSGFCFYAVCFFVRRASAFSFRHDKNEIAYLFLRMEKEVSRGLYHF